jgi:hypothetical protein
MYPYKTMLGLLCTLLLVGITACSGDTTNTKFGNAGRPTNDAAHTRSGTNTTNVSRGSLFNIHDNTSIVMNQSLARQIAALPEVKSAQVVSTESNVYVAVRLNDQSPSDHTLRNNRITGNAMHHDANQQPAATPRPYSGITGNSYDHAQSLNNNPTPTSDIAMQTKQKIMDRVRSLSDPSLHHVYISANQDLVQVFENYARDAQQGKPFSGGINGFNVLVQRIFPTTHGTGAYGGSTSSGKPSVNYTNSGDSFAEKTHR